MRYISGFCLASFALVLSGCTAPVTDPQPDTWSWTGLNPTVQTIKVGIIAPLSGPAASYGEDVINLITDITHEFNASQKQYNIVLIPEDGKCNWKDSASAAQKLTTIDNVTAILGWVCSSETLGAGKVTQDNNTILLSAWSSAPDISKLGDYVYRFLNDTFVAQRVAEFVLQKWENVEMVTENTDFAKWFANAFKSSYKGSITSEFTYNSDEKDLRILAANLSKNVSNTDFILISNQSDTSALALISAFKGVWILDQLKGKVLFTVGISSSEVIKQLGADAEQLYTYGLSDTLLIGENKDLISEFEQKHGIKWEAMYIPLVAESVELLIDAIKAWNTDSAAIKAYFDTINSSNIRTWRFWDYYFDENWDAQWLQMLVQQVQDGEIVIAK